MEACIGASMALNAAAHAAAGLVATARGGAGARWSSCLLSFNPHEP